jgi:hypothetical protein
MLGPEFRSEPLCSVFRKEMSEPMDAPKEPWACQTRRPMCSPEAGLPQAKLKEE